MLPFASTCFASLTFPRTSEDLRYRSHRFIAFPFKNATAHQRCPPRRSRRAWSQSMCHGLLVFILPRLLSHSHSRHINLVFVHIFPSFWPLGSLTSLGARCVASPRGWHVLGNSSNVVDPTHSRYYPEPVLHISFIESGLIFIILFSLYILCLRSQSCV